MLLIITQWEHMAAVFSSVCLPFAAMPLLQNIGSKHRSDFFRVSDRALLAALMLDSVFGFLHVYSMTTMGGALLYDPHMWLLSARLLFFFSAAASWISSITSGPPPPPAFSPPFSSVTCCACSPYFACSQEAFLSASSPRSGWGEFQES